jgi:hypothetical protein
MNDIKRNRLLIKIMTMISLYASEISACVGLNKYKKVVDIIPVIWKRHDPSGYTNAWKRNSKIDPIESYEQRKQEIMSILKPDKIQDIIDSNDQKSFQTNLQESKEIVGTDNKNDMNIINDVIYTERGKKNEEGSIQILEKKTNQTIHSKNSKVYKSYIQYNDISGIPKRFLIRGKVDGISEDLKIIEVKNRQNNFFSSIPIYEKIQTHVYMFLTGISESLLVQCFNGETREELIEFDEEFWIKKIKEPLIEFVTKMDNFLIDEKEQDLFICDL